MFVKNMQSPQGNDVPNQFIITSQGNGVLGNFIERQVFQSYKSIIAIRTIWRHEDVVGHGGNEIDIEIDENKWDYSRTTGKYRNIFLNEDKKTTLAKIKNGTYKLANLN